MSPVYQTISPQEIPEDILTSVDPRLPSAGLVMGGTNRAFLHRVTARKSGFLRDLVQIVTVSSGLIDIGLYDTGDTTPNTLTRLASWAAANAGVAQACPATGFTPAVTWDPGAGAVPIVMGRQYVLAVACDNNTAAFTRYVMIPTIFPAPYYVTPGGMQGKMGGLITTGIAAGVLPTTIPEANIGVTQVLLALYGRISTT